jgi:hypothetical protein
MKYYPAILDECCSEYSEYPCNLAKELWNIPICIFCAVTIPEIKEEHLKQGDPPKCC